MSCHALAGGASAADQTDDRDECAGGYATHSVLTALFAVFAAYQSGQAEVHLALVVPLLPNGQPPPCDLTREATVLQMAFDGRTGRVACVRLPSCPGSALDDRVAQQIADSVFAGIARVRKSSRRR